MSANWISDHLILDKRNSCVSDLGAKWHKTIATNQRQHDALINRDNALQTLLRFEQAVASDDLALKIWLYCALNALRLAEKLE